MSLIEIVLTALALSIDSFVCSTICGKRPLSSQQKLYTALAIAFAFGFFQFLMPIMGFYAGFAIQDRFASYDHWIAFTLLSLVAGNMLKEVFFGVKDNREDGEDRCNISGDGNNACSKIVTEGDRKLQIGMLTLTAMAIATSIDALAIGVSYGLIQDTIMLAATLIGIVCFICSLIGFSIGQVFSRFRSIDTCLNITGALVLLAIGVRILFEHGVL